MTILKALAALGFAAIVSACSAPVDTASRAAPFVTGAATPGDATQASQLPDLRVEKITVSVPRSLKVSEANRYYPSGDIVWREDPMGDRHMQVKAIFETAMQRGTAALEGSTPVTLHVDVMRFHALTEKTRYTVGGIHSLTFAMTLRDARTGAVLVDHKVVKADLQGFGGQMAIDAMARGQTQKVRITGHLANVIRSELQDPGGYRNAKLGLIQTLNKI
ncbi:DUF6778 family protein [Sulfitobacter sabulilitoris]|uniref:DUF3313 domain-containing protein n=1 Tax=Sulfitobacter sabulilitoris TaxID=2562655 RepID=A0A5S3PJE4_9RHOB|nr:DUF6778 family protein [Sulfitobacter sabulilitoris]TMM54431.1 hypothetical protein FDT80_02220 [Sulfitobacter sabulilitoris]